MKKIFFIFIVFYSIHIANSQNIFVSGDLGLAYIVHNKPQLPNTLNTPVGVSFGSGTLNIQFGGEWIHTPLLKEEYVIENSQTPSNYIYEVFIEDYKGVFIRYNSSKDPYNINGVILKFGMGYLNTEKRIYDKGSMCLIENGILNYDGSVQINGEIGINTPLFEYLSLYIGGGMTHTIKSLKNDNILLYNYKQTKFVLKVGLTLNFKWIDSEINSIFY